METGSRHGVTVVDRFEMFRCLVSLGLNDTAVAADGLRPTRMHKLDPLFIKAGSALRAHVLKQHKIPKWCGTDQSSATRQLKIFDCGLMRGSRRTVTRQPCRHRLERFSRCPPLPAFPALYKVARYGGTLFVEAGTARQQQWWGENSLRGKRAGEGGNSDVETEA